MLDIFEINEAFLAHVSFHLRIVPLCAVSVFVQWITQTTIYVIWNEHDVLAFHILLGIKTVCQKIDEFINTNAQ